MNDAKQKFAKLKTADRARQQMRGWPEAIIEHEVDEDGNSPVFIINARPSYGTDGEVIGGQYLRESGYVA